MVYQLETASANPRSNVTEELGPLLATAEQDHAEGRNRGIRWSLDFSIRHLSPAARDVLPAIALLSGGCLENMAAMVAGLDDEAWPEVRAEFERTGLVRREGPWLRPHPVLDTWSFAGEPDAPASFNGKPEAPASGETETETSREDASGSPLNEGESTQLEDRFLAVVVGLCVEFDQMVRTPQSKQALGVLAGSEVVVRRAIALATRRGQLEPAWAMADSLKRFLELTGRGSEGAALMTETGSTNGAATLGDLANAFMFRSWENCG